MSENFNQGSRCSERVAGERRVWIEMSNHSDSSNSLAGASHSSSTLELPVRTSRESGASDNDLAEPLHEEGSSNVTLESMRQMMSSFVSAVAEDEAVGSVLKRTPKWHRSARFMINCLVHIANLVLRVWALVIYFDARGGMKGIVVVQCGLELVAAVVSLSVCWKDADVQRWIRSCPCILRLPAALMIFSFFGIFQVIHVKRAWARQLHVADVLGCLEEKDFLWTGPALGAEHALPIALLTGVPFALVSFYGFLTLEHEYLRTFVLGFATLSALLVVSMGVVEVDVAVSAYVAKRYHFDPSRRGTRAGRLQCMYPLFHVIFRTAEVITRVAFLMVFMVVMIFVFKWKGKPIAVGFIFIDYSLGVYVLHSYSPSSEAFLVHAFVGVGLLLSNIVFFVDMPGFCRPARLIGRSIEWWRVVELVAFSVFCAMEVPQGILVANGQLPPAFSAKQGGVHILQGIYVLGASFLVHTVMRFSPLALKIGDDLHTAVLKSHLERVKKLLDAGPGGETLDVNGRMKDAEQSTPVMLAASVGNVEALRLLADAGARLHLRNSKGETCLHYAVRNVHLDALIFITSQRGAKSVLRSNLTQLRELAERNSKRLEPQRRLQFLSLLEPNATRSSISNHHNLASVRPEQARGRHLGNLFPDAVQEEVPPCSELNSVSGLVLAHALGGIARLILPRGQEHDGLPTRWASESGLVSGGCNVTLESLRRVRKLGQGAFGHVIEVEVVDPMEAASPLGSTISFAKHLVGGSMASSRRRPSNRLANWLDPVRRSACGEQLDRQVSLGTSMHPEDPPSRFAMKLQPKTQAHAQWQACSELLALKRAVHPFIVRLEQAFQTPQYFALLLEFCPGGDVNRLLCNTKDEDGECSGLPADVAAKYAGQVLLALVHLHEALGIVYRDVKPENILLTANEVAKLADFGLACYVGNTERRRMAVVGTAGYLAPELVFGAGDDEDECDDGVNPFKTDAYSLGVTLEVMLLGKDCADITEDADGGRWMVPNAGSEAENAETLASARAGGRLQEEALDLLLGLSPHRPSERLCLGDSRVKNHPFFLVNLQCQDIESHLLPPAPMNTPSLGGKGKLDGPSHWHNSRASPASTGS